MAEDTFDIPVIDFAKLSLDKNEDEACKEDLEILAHQICAAFKTVGFLYLENHGISESKFMKTQHLAKQFFRLPVEVKRLYDRGGTDYHHGWVGRETERTNPDRPSDLKEIYEVSPSRAKDWPEEQVPGFKPCMTEIYDLFSELAKRVHLLIGIGLKLEDPYLFRKTQNPMGEKSATLARLIYYPEIQEKDIKQDQIRCGEHCDLGTITFLMQDDVGGLELMNRQGKFVPAQTIPGTVVVNVGHLLQRWTSDELVANKHRVVNPIAETGVLKERLSFGYFVQPDKDCEIRCLDGSDKYEPITSGEYMDNCRKSFY